MPPPVARSIKRVSVYVFKAHIRVIDDATVVDEKATTVIPNGSSLGVGSSQLVARESNSIQDGSACVVDPSSTRGGSYFIGMRLKSLIQQGYLDYLRIVAKLSCH